MRATQRKKFLLQIYTACRLRRRFAHGKCGGIERKRKELSMVIKTFWGSNTAKLGIADMVVSGLQSGEG